MSTSRGLCSSRREGHSGRVAAGYRQHRSTLIDAARAAGCSKGTYLAAQYHRLAVRRGTKRAASVHSYSLRRQRSRRDSPSDSGRARPRDAERPADGVNIGLSALVQRLGKIELFDVGQLLRPPA
jgi:hypothetical protein